ncbi:MAG: hypothetical protein ABR576_05230 [Thermoanaerobaculia bacterium]
MKRILWITIAILGLAGRGLGDGHLTGSVTITGGYGGSISSLGSTSYTIYPPAHDNMEEQIYGSHKISFDGFGMDGLIAYRGFGPTRSIESFLAGIGAPGLCYRARVEANMPSRSNAWGSHQECVDPPPPPAGGTGGWSPAPNPYSWCDTPLVVDLDGDGLRLSGARDPVSFDLTADGEPEWITWTDASGNDGLLAIDLNRNGRIDDGRELFGRQTLLPLTGEAGSPHGFRPLADYDAQALGGNENRMIDGDDAVFSELRVWVDRNHNGLSEPAELLGLAAAGIHSIAYGYGFADSRDEHGNVLWLEGRAWKGSGEIKVYDVIFLYADAERKGLPDVPRAMEALQP